VRQEILRKAPNHYLALCFLGLIHFKKDEHVQAEEVYRKATQSDPKALQAWMVCLLPTSNTIALCQNIFLCIFWTFLNSDVCKKSLMLILFFFADFMAELEINLIQGLSKLYEKSENRKVERKKEKLVDVLQQILALSKDDDDDKQAESINKLLDLLRAQNRHYDAAKTLQQYNRNTKTHLQDALAVLAEMQAHETAIKVNCVLLRLCFLLS
jgi:tetratricopeptide (TPR) repeat protein